jgi:hypothetical protein
MKSLKRVGWVIGIAGLLLWNGLPAIAQTRNPCADDINEFCKDVKPGAGRIVRYLKRNEEQLSPECRETLKKSRKKRE